MNAYPPACSACGEQATYTYALRADPTVAWRVCLNHRTMGAEWTMVRQHMLDLLKVEILEDEAVDTPGDQEWISRSVSFCDSRRASEIASRFRGNPRFWVLVTAHPEMMR